MRIGFDVTPLAVAHSGVGRYVSQLLSGLRTHVPNNEYHLLTNRPLVDASSPDASADLVGADSRLSFPIKTIWMQLLVPRAIRRAHLDLCHFTNFVAPIAAPGPLVVTFHDMSLFLMPGCHTGMQLVSVRPFLPLIARRANAIITVSESARQDLLHILRPPAQRVHVVYEAATADFRPIEDEEHLSAVAARYQLTPGFLLHVGTIEPRKNLIRVVEALYQLHRAGLPLRLIVVGQLGWKYKSLLARIDALGLRDNVRFLGYVPDVDVPAIFNLASVLVFPSLYEGFGLPIVEAMACGTPVITSHVAATAEVAGEAALLVDPRRSSEIAEAVAAALGDAQLRQRLSAAGRIRAAQFSWERAARETAAIYQTAFAGAPSRSCATA